MGEECWISLEKISVGHLPSSLYGQGQSPYNFRQLDMDLGLTVHAEVMALDL